MNHFEIRILYIINKSYLFTLKKLYLKVNKVVL